MLGVLQEFPLSREQQRPIRGLGQRGATPSIWFTGAICNVSGRIGVLQQTLLLPQHARHRFRAKFTNPTKLATTRQSPFLAITGRGFPGVWQPQGGDESRPIDHLGTPSPENRSSNSFTHLLLGKSSMASSSRSFVSCTTRLAMSWCVCHGSQGRQLLQKVPIRCNAATQWKTRRRYSFSTARRARLTKRKH